MGYLYSGGHYCIALGTILMNRLEIGADTVLFIEWHHPFKINFFYLKKHIRVLKNDEGD